MIREGRLIVYSGPSGVGKGTVLSKAMKKRKNLIFSVSATTREKREGEIQGVNYFFLSKQEFSEKIEKNEMLEYAQYGSNFYGTPKDFVMRNLKEGKDVILEIEVQGALKVKKIMPQAVLVFLMPPSFCELKERLEGRHTETPKQVQARLDAAAFEISNAHKYDYIIVNHIVDDAADMLLECIDSSHCLTRLNKGLIKAQKSEINKFMKQENE